MSLSRRGAPALVAVLLLGGCGSNAPASSLAPPAPTVAPVSPPQATASAPVPPATRVVVIVMENRSYDSVIGLPYIKTLASTATVLTDYHASGHPSLPNYLALTSGSTWGISDDGYHVLPAQDVGDQLTASGVPWRAYMEGMGSDCKTNTGGYAVKHDPFAYYGGRCQSSVVPFSQFAPDLAGAAPPRFMWITPDLCHDMHDCSSDVGDSWLRSTVPAVLASPAMSNGVLFITWDENDGGGSNQVLTLVLGAKRPATPGVPYGHANLLATVEDLLSVPRLPATQSVAAIALR
jgi:phospholipase C